MSKQLKIVIGIATILPTIYLVVFVGFFVATFLTLFRGGTSPEGAPLFSHFAVFFVLHLIMMLWMIGLAIFYIVNVFRNERVQENRKVLWAVVIFFGSMIAMPIYWYLYVWSEPTVDTQAAAPAAG